MATWLGIAVFVLGVLASIALHEVGHMVPAKRFGVRVSQYFVGFGPTLWSRQRGETEYGVKAFPLGGYVRLVGMIPPASEVKPVRGHGWAARVIEDARAFSAEEIIPGQEHRAFYRLSWWKKVIVMAGGPVTNLLIAVVIFVGFGTLHGVPEPASAVSGVVPCVLPVGEDRDCTATDPQSAAARAGLEPGDDIAAVDGAPVGDWYALRDYVRDRPGELIVLTVIREGSERTVYLVPAAAERQVFDENGNAVVDDDGNVVTEVVGFMGVWPAFEPVRHGPWWGVQETGNVLVSTGHVLVNLPGYVTDAAQAAFGAEDRKADSIASLVGAGRLAGQIASEDGGGATVADRGANLFYLVAWLNIALFAFNMIPLLPLDGGHIASAIWQAVKNGWARARELPRPAPVDVARMMPLAYGMFALLLGMGVLLMYADIVAPIPV